ncbi:odorant receptor 115-11 isoform X1 [Danio rerio]|uniref:Odorant receptor n=1 Tax=Danio rerio TaxID=7955 RepID=Q2PRI3_DANRE|nr:odorant receptor 115-11 [Danio rerio]XP_009293918.1 odorant receptor, family F, subfamily 115, member 11 isoform X1 [Danio rerio]ABC43284.1 odorant receptor [Danio rerio]|eukprot:NP_001124278.1 odorant receptor, family F, subfamily 115, member 11 [Danio rerio]
MDNLTLRYSVLLVEGLSVSPPYSYVAFFSLLTVYIFIMVSNLWILLNIMIDKDLHQPMYSIYSNLPLRDVIGTSVIVPRLLRDVLTNPSERYITYVECALQAFFIHLNGTACHTILMIMAFDRYVAICNPLRYSAIMSNKMVIKLSAGAWISMSVMVGIMISLSVRLSHCRSLIQNHFCDNASLFKLSCESTEINNIYGLTFTVSVIVVSMGSISLTYLRIAIVCISSKNKRNKKAITTCSTHLIVYTIMLVSGFVAVFLHRFSEYYENRRIASIVFSVVPPGLNPLIYGLQVKEIRQKLFKFCK